MSIIKQSKWGDCSNCSACNTNVVKVGKSLFCFNCRNRVKTKEYTERAKQREATRMGSLSPAGNRELDKWFADIAAANEVFTYENFDPHLRCWECNSKIYRPFYRAAVAHIFPKAIFPSVKTHPMNYLILGAGCCHDKTHRLDTFSRMSIFKEAVDRFELFRYSIKEKHKLLDGFIEYANALNLLK